MILATTPAPKGAPALAGREALLVLERNRTDEFNRHSHVVARHQDLDLPWELDRASDVRRGSNAGSLA